MTIRKILLSVAAMVALLALSACGSSQGTPTTVPQPATPTSPNIPTPMPTTEPTSGPSGDTSISFSKTGGIAGIHDTLEITAQAEATYVSRSITRTQTLPAATYDALLKQIAAADFFNLKDEYDNHNVADDFYFTITIRQGGRSKTVQMAGVGGQDLAPQALKDLVAQLADIQDSLSTTGTTITFLTTGGFAGVNDSLTIMPDLTAIYTSRGSQDKRLYLSGDQYNKLLAQIQTADFFNLKDSYQSAAADAFNYSITVAEPNRSKTVMASEAADLPQGLHDLISLLKDTQKQ